MNTPSHSIINLAVLMPLEPTAALPIFLGSVLPDFPMLVLYIWAKGIQKQSERQIWGETYWQPFWQNFTHGFHSIPLAIAGALLSYYAMGSVPLALLFVSAVLHSLGDLPVHHDDAHRHFLPLTGYRFISPLSYWDRRYHAKWVALAEKLLVLLATILVFPQFETFWMRGLLVGINALYWSSYCYRFFVRGCEQTISTSGIKD